MCNMARDRDAVAAAVVPVPIPADHDNDIFLPDVWQWFGHNPIDKDWTLRSYRLLGHPCSSVSDFWKIVNSARPVIERTMIFCMREGCQPIWDDPACVDGSLVSVLVGYDRAATTFVDVCTRALGETLVADTNSDVVGVSMSPKRMHCVIKIWTREQVDAQTVERWSLPQTIKRDDLRIEASRKHISGSHTPS
jgi:hypothetical protein